MKLVRQLFCFAPIVLALATFAPRARAEAPSDQLDLGDEESLVRFAFAHNPDLRVVRWEQDAASAGVTSAAALSNPVARAEWLHVQSPADYGWGVGLGWAPSRPISANALRSSKPRSACATRRWPLVKKRSRSPSGPSLRAARCTK